MAARSSEKSQVNAAAKFLDMIQFGLDSEAFVSNEVSLPSHTTGGGSSTNGLAGGFSLVGHFIRERDR